MPTHTFSLIVANKSNQFSYFTLASLYKDPAFSNISTSLMRPEDRNNYLKMNTEIIHRPTPCRHPYTLYHMTASTHIQHTWWPKSAPFWTKMVFPREYSKTWTVIGLGSTRQGIPWNLGSSPNQNIPILLEPGTPKGDPHGTFPSKPSLTREFFPILLVVQVALSGF